MLVFTLFCVALFVLNENTATVVANSNSLSSDTNQLSKVDDQLIDTKEGLHEKKNHELMKKLLAVYKLVEKMNDASDEIDNTDNYRNSESSESNHLNKRGRFLYSRRTVDDDQLKSLLLAKRRFLKS